MTPKIRKLFFFFLVYVFMNEIFCSYNYLKMQEILMIFCVSQKTKKKKKKKNVF
jgi:hypothetical protein